jgi:HD-GYP domain-containing protein (c-di-GMP phosphodiesterase class II)
MEKASKKNSTRGKIDRDRQLADLKKKNRQLEHELALFKTLGDFEEVGFSIDRLLSNFLSKAMKFFKADAGTVFSVDRDTNELVFRVVRGKARNKLKGRRLSKNVGIVGWVARNGKPYLARNVQHDPRWKRDLAKEVGYPTKDLLAVPLRSRIGKVIGVIELLNKEGRADFSGQDLEHLSSISGSIGSLLENIQLWAETRQHNSQLELLNKVSHLVNSSLDTKEIRRRTIEAATRLVDSEVGSLLLLDPDTDELFFEVALGEKGREVKKVRLKSSEGVAGWVVKHGRPLVILDCDKDPRWSKRVDRVSKFVTRDMICVPVNVKGKTIGALQTINRRTGHYTEEDRDLLMFLANQVAGALENARLFSEVQRTFMETSEALADAIELRDAYTGGHTRRVTQYSLAIGENLGLDDEDIVELRVSAILHDIGKLGVDDQVLRKPGRLDKDEFEQMKRHPQLGAEVLDHIRYLENSLPGIKFHHERPDGRGYPAGLKGKKIPLIARIIAVADTYDAMTSDRPYRKGLNKTVAVKEIIACAESQFDAEVVNAFLKAFKSGAITGKKERVPKVK